VLFGRVTTAGKPEGMWTDSSETSTATRSTPETGCVPNGNATVVAAGNCGPNSTTTLLNSVARTPQRRHRRGPQRRSPANIQVMSRAKNADEATGCMERANSAERLALAPADTKRQYTYGHTNHPTTPTTHRRRVVQKRLVRGLCDMARKGKATHESSRRNGESSAFSSDMASGCLVPP